MSYRLPRVLSPAHFARPELDALRLDGEVFRVDDRAVSVDELPGIPLRAEVLAAELPRGLIAEQLSAAWVWGATPRPPSQHQACADIGARIRPPLAKRLSIREVVIGAEEFVVIAGLAVTTPQRTAIDLARFVPEWETGHSDVVAALMAYGGFTAVDCARVVNARRNLPNKRRALERLALSDAIELLPAISSRPDYPELTR